MGFEITFLGTGTSVGVPQIGCSCRVCTSLDSRDKRWRCGIYVRSEKTAFLIDTPPEMRLACLELDITRVDAVVLTHAHMDHIAGFDDVRRFNTLNGGAPMRCYAASETIDSMRHIFPYITDKPNTQGLFRPMINYVSVCDFEPFELGDFTITPLNVVHGPKTFGYLIEHGTYGSSSYRKMGYISDCHKLDEKVVQLCHGADVMVLNCLRSRPHPTHLSLSESVAYMHEIAPRYGYIVHMCHDLSHQDYLDCLPKGITPSYDGLRLMV